MIGLENVPKEAVAYFDNGYNCSESMLLAFSKALGADCTAIPMLATPFGAGIGRLCHECGVLTGGILAIGLRYGRSSPKDTESRDKSYAIARAYYEGFQRRFGSVKCIKIQGTDLLNQEEARKNAKERHALCDQVVEEGAQMLVRLFSEK